MPRAAIDSVKRIRKMLVVGYSGEPWRLGALNPRFWKIVGNIHENPELLKAAT